MSEIAETAIVYPGTVIGAGCTILDYAVVGKQPTLSPRSTARREELPPLELGAGTIVSTGAIVFAGTRIGERVIIGDQACVRERCEIGEHSSEHSGIVESCRRVESAATRLPAGGAMAGLDADVLSDFL